jgi:hypothetical protein
LSIELNWVKLQLMHAELAGISLFQKIYFDKTKNS